jgi:hypothetical protein
MGPFAFCSRVTGNNTRIIWSNIFTDEKQRAEICWCLHRRKFSTASQKFDAAYVTGWIMRKREFHSWSSCRLIRRARSTSGELAQHFLRTADSFRLGGEPHRIFPYFSHKCASSADRLGKAPPHEAIETSCGFARFHPTDRLLQRRVWRSVSRNLRASQHGTRPTHGGIY